MISSRKKLTCYFTRNKRSKTSLPTNLQKRVFARIIQMYTKRNSEQDEINNNELKVQQQTIKFL